jgi:ABC-2 type transport system permease protein
MTLATFRLDLRRDRALAIWLSVIGAAYAATMAFVYPLMKENTALVDQYLTIMPKEFLVAFGMTGSLYDPGVFFTTYIGSYLWPILAAIAAILMATRPVAADLDRGFLELPLSTPMPRVRYLLVAIVGQVVVMAVLAVFMIAGIVVAGALVGAGFDAGRFLMVTPLAIAFGCAMAGVATLLAVLTLSRGVTAGIGTAILLAMYLGNVLAQIDTRFDWLATISAFHYFDATPLIDEGALPWGALGLYGAVALIGWGLALVLFRRRDLAV